LHGRDDSDSLEAVNVRLPDELLKILDSLVAKGIFSSRSEAIREFCREYAIESKGGAKRG
jgi:Arc/MetJ-type ribon-helix-helix transcriptional regulator